MNEMPIDIEAAQEISSLSSTFNMDEAHILHSKIIAECASVERWLFNQISPFQKPAMMLSQKIDQMEKLLDQDENPSKHAKKMKERLSAFRPFAQFRSEIAHSENELTMLDIRPKPSCTSRPAKTSVTPAKAGV